MHWLLLKIKNLIQNLIHGSRQKTPIKGLGQLVTAKVRRKSSRKKARSKKPKGK